MMTPSSFKKRLCEHGFAFVRNATFGDRFTRGQDDVKQHVARDTVRGGGWRLFLAVGDVPEVWPTSDLSGEARNVWVEAESPWFNYFTDLDPSDPEDAQFDTREAALDKCFDWLTTIGFEWLTDPWARSLEDWRKTYNILIKRQAEQGAQADRRPPS
jgi:hypothetical protein